MQMRKEHKFVDDEILSIVTNQLTEGDLENKNNYESSWADAPYLTNNDPDRIEINHDMAKSVAIKKLIVC